MKPTISIFKGLIEWMSKQIKEHGAGNMVTSTLLIILIIIFLSGGYTDRIIHGVGREIEEVRTTQFEQHQELWLQSREVYSEIKTLLRKERPKTAADYILYLEYHNGSENIATGYSFCKFDVSMSVRSDTVPVLPIEDFRNENIWSWDMLLTDEVVRHKMTSVSLEDALGIDPGMVHRIHPNEHTQYVVFYNIVIDDICAGTLMFLYKSPEIVNYTSITTCGSRVENTINNSIKKHRQELEESRHVKNKGRK